ncbi:hypothetical protein SAMN05444422_11318 [Halobiforma haloterrestris]|uniref:RCK C-terminal domain-containing protein n=1 Tax=Natronobacterium haloterrestre TaxID=148448 RepID=A0A1I1L2L2_NATHA|nr:hypothetical protein [Halobiforma haloterrestris]SFC64653.1 hypothetical protein SAMN05444422_11318 [Halobiforma haloterrestris]
MFELTTAILIAVAFGVLLGTGPAVAVFGLTVGLEAIDRTVPRAAAVLVALALAAGNGYAVGLPISGEQVAGVGGTTLLLPVAVGTFVIAALGLYAHSQAERVAADLPLEAVRPARRGRGLSAAALESVDAAGRVAVAATGAVRDLEGHPSLDPALRQRLETDSWRLPADLPLSALESRLEANLRTSYDLAAVSASIDERGRATVAAAPPANGVSSRVPEGWRAVTIRALVPTGLAATDTVVVRTGSEAVRGRVLSVGQIPDEGHSETSASEPENRALERVTVAVPTADADPLLEADRARIVVVPGPNGGGADADTAACALLERADQSIRSVPFGRLRSRLASGDVDATLEDDVAVLAARVGTRDREHDDRTATVEDVDRSWVVDPDLGSVPLEWSDAVIVAGTRTTMKRLLDPTGDCASSQHSSTRAKAAEEPASCTVEGS